MECARRVGTGVAKHPRVSELMQETRESMFSPYCCEEIKLSVASEPPCIAKRDHREGDGRLAATARRQPRVTTEHATKVPRVLGYADRVGAAASAGILEQRRS